MKAGYMYSGSYHAAIEEPTARTTTLHRANMLRNLSIDHEISGTDPSTLNSKSLICTARAWAASVCGII